MRPDKVLQTWAWVMLFWGIVVPSVITATAVLYSFEDKLKQARIEGCLQTVRTGHNYNYNDFLIVCERDIK